MKKLGELLKELRGKESLRNASERIGISHTYLDTIEKGFDKRSGKPVKPTPDTLKLISKAYDCSYEELMKVAGYIENKIPQVNVPKLTPKEENDIAKKLENILDSMETDTALSFNGEPMDEETKELVRAAIESNLILTKQLAKKKFTPKKYRKE